MIDTLELLADAGQFDRSPVPGAWQVLTTADEVTGEAVSSRRVSNGGNLFATVFDDGVMTMHTSAPKFLYGDSLHEVTESDLVPFCDGLDRRLRKIGVRCDVRQLPVKRVDYARNLRVSHPVADYLGVLSQFSIARRRTQEHDHSVRFGNLSKQLICYDKVQEQRDLARKQRDEAMIRRCAQIRGNVLRVEARLLRRRVVRSVSGMAEPRIADLWSRERSRLHLLAEFDDVLNTGAVVPMASDLTGIVETFKRAREVFARGALYRLASVHGSGDIVRTCGGWDSFRDCLRQAGYNERSIQRIVARFRREFVGSLTQGSQELLSEVRGLLAA